jgi:3'-phosphoadenosine 5'-phosphosulfate sulfotransferase (PAPS reductase)/FAD synthetase
MSQSRIRQFYDHYQGDVYVSFSGGKDSTVLLDLVRDIYPDVPAVFVDTGLEYPEIREFVKTIDNVTWLRPKMPFNKVIEKYGYPVVSKEQARYIRDCQNPTPNNKITRRRRLTGIDRNGKQKKSGMISKKWRFLIDSPFQISEKCCDVMKKAPVKIYVKKTGRKQIVGTMASDSMFRMQSYLRVGCNAFEKGSSQPMAFWLEQDVWDYIHSRNLPYCSVYDTGVKRTGCMFCMFGVHLEKEPNRFQRMQETHPKLWDYCINKLGCGKVLDYIGVPYVKEKVGHKAIKNHILEEETNQRTKQ